MIFASTLGIVWMSLLTCHALGRNLVRLLPWTLRPAANAVLASVIGLASYTLIIVPFGWLGPGFGSLVVRITLAVVAIGSLLTLYRSDRWFLCYLRVAAFATVVTAPFTLQLLRYGTFDAFNDPWTYQVQSQWLQKHNLSESVELRNETAVLTQVWFTQHTGTRVAAQFVLAAVQGAFGLAHPHQAYPIVLCLAWVAGALAIVYAGFAASGRSRLLPWLVGLAFGVTLNGFTFGGLRGYLPQTLGLSLTVGALILLAQVLKKSQLRWTYLLPPAVLASASVYSYSEFLPFAAVGAGMIFITRFAWRRSLNDFLQQLSGFCILFILLTGVELPRAARALISQSKSIVGEGIPWEPAQYLLHTLGGIGGYPDGAAWFGFCPSAAYSCAVLVLLCGIVGAAQLSLRRFTLVIAPLAIIGASFGLFIYFRYWIPAPFALGTGQSWSQFKLAGWGSVFAFWLVSIGTARLCISICWSRMLGLAWLSVVLIGLVQSWHLAALRTEKVRTQFGFDYAPLDQLARVAEKVERTTSDLVRLEFGPSHNKSRQYLALFLLGRPIVSNWNDDVFVNWMLPPAQRDTDPRLSPWVLRHRASASPGDEDPVWREGNFQLNHENRARLSTCPGRGDYPVEQYPEGVLVWARQKIIYNITRPATREPQALFVQFELLTVVPDAIVRVSLPDGLFVPIARPEAYMSWSRPAWVTTELMLPPGPASVIEVMLTTDSTPVRLSPMDARKVTFFVRNFRSWMPLLARQ